MWKHFFLSLVVALFLAATAHAGSKAAVAWLGAELAYDPAHWRVSQPGGGADLLIACIADDCPGQPTVYAFAWKAAGKAGNKGVCRLRSDGGDGVFEAKPLALPFSVSSGWSGCRALDNPVHEACATESGLSWRFTTNVGGGCNRNPELPLDRFIELLAGVKPIRVPVE